MHLFTNESQVKRGEGDPTHDLRFLVEEFGISIIPFPCFALLEEYRSEKPAVGS